MPTIHTRVKGVTYANPDGTCRQSIIARLSPNSPLVLTRDYANLYDRNAVMVMTADGQQLGFLDRDLARQIASLMDLGRPVSVVLHRIVGGTDGFYSGVEIVVSH